MLGHLNEEQMQEVLTSNAVGRVCCSDGEKLYIVPINYVCDGKYIIAHSLTGLKIRMMRKHPKVCFEVDEIKSFTNWKSVIAWGEYREITDEKEKYAAMKLFVDRMLHLKLSETAIPPEISEKRAHPRSPGNIELVVYRIRLDEKTGRYESPEPRE